MSAEKREKLFSGRNIGNLISSLAGAAIGGFVLSGIGLWAGGGIVAMNILGVTGMLAGGAIGNSVGFGRGTDVTAQNIETQTKNRLRDMGISEEVVTELSKGHDFAQNAPTKAGWVTRTANFVTSAIGSVAGAASGFLAGIVTTYGIVRTAKPSAKNAALVGGVSGIGLSAIGGLVGGLLGNRIANRPEDDKINAVVDKHVMALAQKYQHMQVQQQETAGLKTQVAQLQQQVAAGQIAQLQQQATAAQAATSQPSFPEPQAAKSAENNVPDHLKAADASIQNSVNAAEAKL